MKRALSIALVLTLIFNQISASCIAKSTESFQSESTQVETQAKKNLSKSDEALKGVVDQVLAELKKREELKSDASKNEKQNKSSLPVRVLKTLFKPVYWVGKAGVFVVKQFLWLMLGSLMAILGSVGTTYWIFKTGSAEIKVVNDSLVEMNKLIEHLKENPQLAEGILSRMFDLLSNCKEKMQPDELDSFLKEILRTFHPDKLKELRNMPKEKAQKIYQLANKLKDKK